MIEGCGSDCVPTSVDKDRARTFSAAGPMVNAVLERLYHANAVEHRDGKRRRLCPPGITVEKGEYLFRLVRELRPELTLEIGFAYGVSTLFLAEALRQNGHGHHIVIDPNQGRSFDNLGLRHLEEAGLRRWVTFYEEPSDLCLPRLVSEGVRLDFAFNDSGHLFDHVVTEFVFLARLLRRGAPLVFDDPGLPGVQRACRFIATNRRDFTEIVDEPPSGFFRRLFDRNAIPPPPRNARGKPLFRTFAKTLDEDPRDWSDFTEF